MSDVPGKVVRLGARGSLLSRMQSGMVAKSLEAAWPGLRVELVPMTTTGDQVHDRPLHEIGGKGLFTRELEQALLRGDVDFAVHSFKDVPVTMPLVDTSELIIAATPKREDPRDVLASTKGRTIADLAPGARVGTGSFRRQAQLLAARGDLKIEPIRGNVDTRLRKLRAGEYDAVVLAMAGLKRSGLFDSSCMMPLDIHLMLPAAGQGALALECRRDDANIRKILATLNDPDSAAAVAAERAVVLGLNGDCHSPIAAYAQIAEGKMRLQAAVAARGGLPPVITAEATVDAGEGANAAATVVNQLQNQGAMKLLGT